MTPEKLTYLGVEINNFPSQDLAFLTRAINLETLCLKDNEFTGSLDYLSNMKKLKVLYIGSTDLNEVNIDKLPRSLEKVCFFAAYEGLAYKASCELDKILPLLGKYRYGFCQKCQQPNTSEN